MAARSIEVLAPLYADVARAAAQTDGRVHVQLRRTVNQRLSLVFSALDEQQRRIVKGSACVNSASGGSCGSCEFENWLIDLLELQRRELLHVEAEYVVRQFDKESEQVATLLLQISLHGNTADYRGPTSLRDFEVALSHLQELNLDGETAHEPMGLNFKEAKHSKCHVIGCKMHLSYSWWWNQYGSRQRLRLPDVFHSLTSHTAVEQMEVRDDETYLKRMRAAASGSSVILTDLPTTALQNIVCMMNSRDLAALSSVCSVFQHLSYEVVPGLNLTLFEHQRRALKWMLRRESSLVSRRDATPHPYIFPSFGVDSGGSRKGMVIDTLNCKLVDQSMAVVQDTRGGLLCDEPGLGKTITVIALILRTLGQRSSIQNTLESLTSSRRFSSTTMSLRSTRAGTRGREVPVEDLIPSRASLIVVPDPLVNHWKYQIEMHVAKGALRVFIDENDKIDLPSSSTLAKYDVVVTTFTRLVREWKFHRPASSLEVRMPDRYGFEDAAFRYADGQERGSVSSLLTVNWIRIVADEGHKLGAQTTTLMDMAQLLSVERRWVMTGTPTPNTLRSADLRHMHGLLVFLRNLPYGNPDGKAWNKAITRPFEQNEPIAFYRLKHLLSRIMIRHTKESIRQVLPEPIRQVVYVDPSPSEYEDYNSILATVRGNLVLTKYDIEKPGKRHPDSLLHPDNQLDALLLMRNLRDATFGGSSLEAKLSAKDRAETLNMLIGYNVAPELVEEVSEFLRRVQIKGIHSTCGCCQRPIRVLMLIPCGHMCCADCIEDNIFGEVHKCFKCGKVYDHEDFQSLQPGIQFTYIEADDDETVRRGNRRRRRLGQRDDEEGIAYTSDLRHRLYYILNNLRLMHPSVCADPGQVRYSVMNSNKETIRRGTHMMKIPRSRIVSDEVTSEVTSVSLGDSSPLAARVNRSSFIPINLETDFDTVQASKAYYAVARIRELRDEHAKGNVTRPSLNAIGPQVNSLSRPKTRNVKAIVFSQFNENIWRTRVVFAQQNMKTTSFIGGVKAEQRTKELIRFRNDPSVNVLLMSEVGSYGLDLSFVTHIFLLDEIWDKSVENQVISRAHRMGATQSVVVEQIIMRDSIETVMHAMHERGLEAIIKEEKDEDLRIRLALTSRATSASKVSIIHVDQSKKRTRLANASASTTDLAPHSSRSSGQPPATLTTSVSATTAQSPAATKVTPQTGDVSTSRNDSRQASVVPRASKSRPQVNNDASQTIHIQPLADNGASRPVRRESLQAAGIEPIPTRSCGKKSAKKARLQSSTQTLSSTARATLNNTPAKKSPEVIIIESSSESEDSGTALGSANELENSGRCSSDEESSYNYSSSSSAASGGGVSESGGDDIGDVDTAMAQMLHAYYERSKKQRNRTDHVRKDCSNKKSNSSEEVNSGLARMLSKFCSEMQQWQRESGRSISEEESKIAQTIHEYLHQSQQRVRRRSSISAGTEEKEPDVHPSPAKRLKTEPAPVSTPAVIPTSSIPNASATKSPRGTRSPRSSGSPKSEIKKIGGRKVTVFSIEDSEEDEEKSAEESSEAGVAVGNDGANEDDTVMVATSTPPVKQERILSEQKRVRFQGDESEDQLEADSTSASSVAKEEGGISSALEMQLFGDVDEEMTSSTSVSSRTDVKEEQLNVGGAEAEVEYTGEADIEDNSDEYDESVVDEENEDDDMGGTSSAESNVPTVFVKEERLASQGGVVSSGDVHVDHSLASVHTGSFTASGVKEEVARESLTGTLDGRRVQSVGVSSFPTESAPSSVLVDDEATETESE